MLLSALSIVGGMELKVSRSRKHARPHPELAWFEDFILFIILTSV